MAVGLAKSLHRRVAIADVGYDIVAAVRVSSALYEEQVALQNFRGHAVAFHAQHKVGAPSEDAVKNEVVLDVVDRFDRPSRGNLAYHRQPHLTR
ncbi:MAG: hypothetical protein WA447_18610 [Candidatus Binatus sp.]